MQPMRMLLYMEDMLSFNIQNIDNVAAAIKKSYGRDPVFFFGHTDEKILREMKSLYESHKMETEFHFLLMYVPHTRPWYIVSKKYVDGKDSVLGGMPSIQVSREKKDYVENVSAPFVNGIFDFVMFNNGMTSEIDLPKVDEFIRESKRYLKRNGELQITMYYDSRVDCTCFQKHFATGSAREGFFIEEFQARGFEIEGMERDSPESQPIGVIDIGLRNLSSYILL